MTELLDIVKVIAKKNYSLLLTFENKETRLFNMKPFLEKKPFKTLKNIKLFMQPTIKYGTVTWAGDIDISPEALFDKSIPQKGV